MKVKIKKRRLSILEFERRYRNAGKYIISSDICGCIKNAETVQAIVSFTTMFACVEPNIIWFNNKNGDFVAYYQVRYVEVVEFPEQNRTYFKIVCAGWFGDVKYLVHFEK